MKFIIGVSVLLALLLSSSAIVKQIHSIDTSEIPSTSNNGPLNLETLNNESLPTTESPNGNVSDNRPVLETQEPVVDQPPELNEASKPASTDDSNVTNLQEKRNLSADQEAPARVQQEQAANQQSEPPKMIGMPREMTDNVESEADVSPEPREGGPVNPSEARTNGKSSEEAEPATPEVSQEASAKLQSQPRPKQSTTASSSARGLISEAMHMTPQQQKQLAYQSPDGQLMGIAQSGDAQLPPPRVIEKNQEVQPSTMRSSSNSGQELVQQQQQGAQQQQQQNVQQQVQQQQSAQQQLSSQQQQQLATASADANGQSFANASITTSTARTYGLDWTSCNGVDSGKAGVCKNDVECKKSKGRSEGSCMAGLGVCCVIALSCGDKSSENNTFFANPDFPEGSWEARLCEVEIKKKSKNVLQVMIEFEEFDLAPPSEDGECLTDVFQVKLSSARPSPYSLIRLCGQNAGQHLYLDVSQIDDPIVLSVATSGAGLARRWSIKIVQMDEKNHLLAPPGCLQYYTDTVGHFRSFNLGRNLRNLYYAVCFRIDNGYTGLRFIDNFFGMSGPMCPQMGRKKPQLARLPYGGPHGGPGYGPSGPKLPPGHYPQHLVIPPPGYLPPPHAYAQSYPQPPQQGYAQPQGYSQPQPGHIQQQSAQPQPQIQPQQPYNLQAGRYKRTMNYGELDSDVESNYTSYSHGDASSESDRLYNIRRTRTHPDKDSSFDLDGWKKTSSWHGHDKHGFKGHEKFEEKHDPGYGPASYGYEHGRSRPEGHGYQNYGPHNYGPPGYGPHGQHGLGYGPPGYGEGPPGYHHEHMHHKEIDKFGKKYEQMYYQHEQNHKKADKKDDKWWNWSSKKDDKKDKDKDKKDKKETRHHEALFPEVDMFEPPHCEPRFCGGTDVITFPPSGESISEMCGNRFNRGRGSIIVTGTPLVVYVSNRGVSRGFGFDMIYEQVFAVPHHHGHHGHR